jgi:GAF domain-containing protein
MNLLGLYRSLKSGGKISKRDEHWLIETNGETVNVDSSVVQKAIELNMVREKQDGQIVLNDNIVITSNQVDVSYLYDKVRLAAVIKSQLMNNEFDEVIEDCVHRVTTILDCPISIMTIIDGEVQFLKSSYGLTDSIEVAKITPLSETFCQFTVANKGEFVVENSLEHPLLKDINTPGILAYMGHPIKSDGEVVGTLCAMDRQPRKWTAHELATLKIIANMVNLHIQGVQIDWLSVL